MNDENENGGGNEDDQSDTQSDTQSARDLRLKNTNNNDRYTREDDRPQRIALQTIPPNVGLPRPNGSRLRCGALKKDSFRNLRAPPASSAR